MQNYTKKKKRITKKIKELKLTNNFMPTCVVTFQQIKYFSHFSHGRFFTKKSYVRPRVSIGTLKIREVFGISFMQRLHSGSNFLKLENELIKTAQNRSYG